MKKSIVALTVVLMATLSIMTSCKKEEGLTLKDLAGYTFEGKQVNEDKSEVIYIRYLLTKPNRLLHL